MAKHSVIHYMPNVLEDLASGIVVTEFDSDTGIATVSAVSGWLYENLGIKYPKLTLICILIFQEQTQVALMVSWVSRLRML